MAGKRQKHPDMLAFHRAGRYRSLHPAQAEPPAPPCPQTASAETREAWARLWQSPLRRVIGETDLPALYRWAWWYDQWLRTSDAISRYGPITRGKRGDDVLNTRVRYLRTCEASLEKLEESFGMTPLARMRLGISAVEGRSAVERLKASIQPRPLDDPLDALREPVGDPRDLLRGEGG